MRGGSSPGQRRGGRRKGSLNKATVEKALIAEQVIARAEMTGTKLAKEVLGDFMTIFADMAAKHQPIDEGQPIPPGREPNIDLFERWARLAVETAKALAPFQSPTFRAVAVAAPIPQQAQPRATPYVISDDPNEAMRTYVRIMRADH